MDNSIIEEVKKLRAGCRFGDNYISASLLDKIIIELSKVREDPASFSDPRAPVEAEDVRRVLDIIRSNDDLFVRFEYLRARLQAGEDVTGDLITFGYLIAKTEGSKEDEKKHKKDNC